MVADVTESLKPYYRRPEVRERIREFLGGKNAGAPTCDYITADGPSRAERTPRPPRELDAGLDAGLDICRSIADHESLVAHIDIEYVNFDFAAEPFLNPERIFELQEPVCEATGSLLGGAGIDPLHVLTGRGHHYAWSIKPPSTAFKTLVSLGELAGESRRKIPRRTPQPLMARAFRGLGLVMEFMAHEIKRLAGRASTIPVELTAVEVGPTFHGREIVSIDLSEYGDPLLSRIVRTPFSGYLKPWQQRAVFGDHVVDNLAPFVFVPITDGRWKTALKTRIPETAAEIAGTTTTTIPDHTEGTKKLAAAYLASGLHEFHKWFYSEEHLAAESWPETYDRLDMSKLTPCTRHILEHPNDLLLKPCGLRHVTHVLLAAGWHPRHIAGLIRSKFERDYWWGDQWAGYNPATRADFYARVFSGLFAVGADDLVDLNCQSAREKGMCCTTDCRENLARIREHALNARNDDQLAGGAIDGVFLEP